ncbi:MAG: Ribonuclease Y [Shouchella clausii]
MTTNHKGKYSTSSYIFAVIALVAIIVVAIWSDIWYRIVVLASLVALMYVFIAKTKKIERELEEMKRKQASTAELARQEQTELEKTKEHDLKALEEKEFQLQKLDLDRTRLFEELLNKSELEEAEKSTMRERLQQADTETSRIRQEWLTASSRLMTLMRGTKRFFVRESPMKEIAASIDQDVLETGSFTALNEEIQRLIPRLSKESAEALAKSDFIDEDNQLTRSGYKALLQASEDKQT